MENTETQLAVVEPQQIQPGGIRVSTLEDALELSRNIVASRLAPKGFDTPEAVFVAVQLGAELGLGPMTALQGIAVINGKPAVWGDAALALVRASGLLAEFREEIVRGDDDANTYATCYALRKGFAPHEPTRFSVADAKKAGLWGKSGPWTQYPKRMLQMRARSFELRDQFTDVLKGLKLAEEVSDYATPIAPEKVRVVIGDEEGGAE